MSISSNTLKEILRQQQEQFGKSEIHLLTTLTIQFQMQTATQSIGNSISTELFLTHFHFLLFLTLRNALQTPPPSQLSVVFFQENLRCWTKVKATEKLKLDFKPGL